MYLAVPHVLPFHLLALLVKLGALQVPQSFVSGKTCSPFSAESSNQRSYSQFCDIPESSTTGVGLVQEKQAFFVRCDESWCSAGRFSRLFTFCVLKKSESVQEIICVMIFSPRKAWG